MTANIHKNLEVNLCTGASGGRGMGGLQERGATIPHRSSLGKEAQVLSIQTHMVESVLNSGEN